jgi:PadR family transcriptional regulator, regulatory protein AphA
MSDATGIGGESGLTAAAYVVLGMVRIGARTGYEIKQLTGQSIRYFWAISPVQIYPSLTRLEEAGLITGREDPQGRRPRRVYEITDAGQAALREWLGRPDPMPFELRDLGLVKLFFADALAPDQARHVLRAVRERSESRVAELRAVEPTARAVRESGDAYPELTLAMGIAVHQALAELCRDFELRYADAGQ